MSHSYLAMVVKLEEERGRQTEIVRKLKPNRRRGGGGGQQGMNKDDEGPGRR